MPSFSARPLTIALLTPYSGRNLGDGAIQASFVENLRRASPDVRLVGITENPARTQAIHGIPCFPLRASARAAGVVPAPVPKTVSEVHDAQPLRASARARLRGAIATIPLVKPAFALLKRALEVCVTNARELREALRAWAFLRDVDVLLIAGGGQLDEEWGGPWTQPFVLWRWSALARLRGAPLATVSVGMGVLESGVGRYFVKQALRRSAYRSYRDEGTRRLLARFAGADVARDPIVPDVALGLPLPPAVQAASPPAGEVTVGLVPIVFGHARHWPTVDVPAYERYVRELAQSVVQLARAGRRVRLFTSNSVDRVTVDDVIARIGESGATDARFDVVDTDSLEQLLMALKTCDLVVASRLHAVILAHRLARPVVAISFDRKVDEQMKQAGLAEFCLDIRTFTCDSIAAALAAIESRSEAVNASLQRYVEEAQGGLDSQFQQLLALGAR